MSIKVIDLNYTYGAGTAFEQHALKHVNFEINDGEFVGLIGHTGSGKSTLLKLLSALLIPTQGLCFVGGTDTSEAKGYELRGISAIVFQNPEDQIVASTVEEEVAFGPENLGCPPEEILARLEEALAATGLGDRREQLVASLSGGQKQRLALAGALAMHPKAILLDEAMSMLDPRSRRDFTEIIAAEHKKGLTIVEVTHRLDEIRGGRQSDRPGGWGYLYGCQREGTFSKKKRSRAPRDEPHQAASRPPARTAGP